MVEGSGSGIQAVGFRAVGLSCKIEDVWLITGVGCGVGDSVVRAWAGNFR